MYWKAQDGRTLQVRDFENGHLVNVIKYVRERKHCNAGMYFSLLNEACRRFGHEAPPHATQNIAGCFANLHEDPTNEFYLNLVQDAYEEAYLEHHVALMRSMRAVFERETVRETFTTKQLRTLHIKPAAMREAKVAKDIWREHWRDIAISQLPVIDAEHITRPLLDEIGVQLHMPDDTWINVIWERGIPCIARSVSATFDLHRHRFARCIPAAPKIWSMRDFYVDTPDLMYRYGLDEHTCSVGQEHEDQVRLDDEEPYNIMRYV